MTAIDIEKLLQPITEENPCGDDLEYDPDFQALERAATPPADDGMFEQDDGKADGLNWREIGEQAEALFGRTKDLRLAVYLTDARLASHGLIGLGEGVTLVKRLLDTYWMEVHPRLDAEDDDDPTMRINSLVALTDSAGLVRRVTQAPLVAAKRAGRYSLRDIRIANNELDPAEGAERPDLGVIDAAFLEAELDELQSAADATAGAIQALNEIEAFLSEQVGATNNTLTVKPLVDELKGIDKVYSQQLAARGVDVDSGESGDDSLGASVSRVSGDITSREDAVRMLEKISEYFRRHEPSSPVPLLLQRAKGLIAKDFLEILKDLTPDGLSQAELFSRPRDEG